MNIELLVDIATEVIGYLVCEGHGFLVITISWLYLFLSLLLKLGFSSFLLHLTNVENWADDALVNTVADEYD